ncbi:hypothetical protein diail_5628, partial [Diaporthe ilicicola]
MAQSSSDQKKAAIVRLAEKECLAEIKTAKAIYELKCLEVQEKYEVKKEQACHKLEQQKLMELDEITRLHNVEMEPTKTKHVERLSAIREQYGMAVPEAVLQASAISESPSSPTMVTASVGPSTNIVARMATGGFVLRLCRRSTDQQKAEADENDTTASNGFLDDTQESSDETDTSIPAIAPKATTKTKHTSPFVNRKRARTLDDTSESDSFGNDTRDSKVDSDGVHVRISQTQPLARSRTSAVRASTHRAGRNATSSASPAEAQGDHSQTASNNSLKRVKAPTSGHHKDNQAEQEDEDESIYSGP